MKAGRRVVTCARTAALAVASTGVAVALLLPSSPAMGDPLGPDPSSTAASAEPSPTVGPGQGLDPTPPTTGGPTPGPSETSEPTASEPPTDTTSPSGSTEQPSGQPSGPPTGSPSASVGQSASLPPTSPTAPAPATPSPTDFEPIPTTTVPDVPVSPAPAQPTVQPPIAWDAADVKASGAAVLQSFTAAPVLVRAVCSGLVFANADPDRSARIGWGDFDRRQPTSTITVPAGKAVRVTTSTARVEWAAHWAGSPTTPYGTAGRGVVSARTDGCATQPVVTAVVAAPCLDRRQPVSVLVNGRVPTGTRWVIAAADSPLTLVDGLLDATRPVTADLSAYGAGQFVLTLIAAGRVLDESTFAVQDCVTADVTCDAVGWTNPSRNSAVTVAFRTSGGVSTQAVRLAPGQSARIAAVGGRVQWNASAMSGSGTRISDAGAEVAVPTAPGCITEPSNSAVADSAAEPAVDDVTPRPSTPGPVERFGWLGAAALVAGLAAGGVAAGAWLRRRRAGR